MFSSTLSWNLQSYRFTWSQPFPLVCVNLRSVFLEHRANAVRSVLQPSVQALPKSHHSFLPFCVSRDWPRWTIDCLPSPTYPPCSFWEWCPARAACPDCQHLRKASWFSFSRCALPTPILPGVLPLSDYWLILIVGHSAPWEPGLHTLIPLQHLVQNLSHCGWGSNLCWIP